MTTLPAERLMKLMAYVDGELDPGERAEVEGWLASDPEAARIVGELTNLSVLVNVTHKASLGASTASFDVADAVMAAVKQEPAPARRDMNVVPLAQARAARAHAPSSRARARWVGGGAAVLALAASVALFVRSQGSHSTVGDEATASAEPGVDVDLVESAGESVKVFYLSTETSATTSVIVWVDESGGNAP
jgi:anti-sigma factor RsiW